MCAPAIAMKSVFPPGYWDISATTSDSEVRQKFEQLKTQYFMLQKKKDETVQSMEHHMRNHIEVALQNEKLVRKNAELEAEIQSLKRKNLFTGRVPEHPDQKKSKN